MRYYDVGDGRDWRAAPLSVAGQAFEGWSAGDREVVAQVLAWVVERRGGAEDIGGYWIPSGGYFRLVDLAAQTSIGTLNHGFLWMDDVELPFGRVSTDGRHRFVQLDGFSPRSAGARHEEDVPTYCPECSARGRMIALPVTGVCDDHGRVVAP